MSYRTISLSPDAKSLFVNSEYNDEIRLIVKSFHGATWNSQRRVWSLPRQHAKPLLEALARFDFHIAEEVLALRDQPQPDETTSALSISEVTAKVGLAIIEAFPEPIWVRGEVSSYDKGAMRRHLFFELIEKMPGRDEIAARLGAVIFHQNRPLIERRLAKGPQPLQLGDGLSVRVQGRLDFYPRSGRIQLIIDDIDPYFTLGQLAKRRQEILDALASDGLLEKNLLLPWPALSFRIGLITAADSDALYDFMQTLQSSEYGFEVFHYPAAVQGPRLEPEVVRALDYFERNADQIELVVIIRGGGSRSDLAWFDNLRVARRVATHPVKVVIGIGHERDRSVLDEIAVSEKTPTAVAERLIALIAGAEDNLDKTAHRLIQRTRQRLALEQQHQHYRTARLKTSVRQVAERARYRLDQQLDYSLRNAVRGRMTLKKSRLLQLAGRLRPVKIFAVLDRAQSHTEKTRDQLFRAVQTQLLGQRRHLELAAARVEALDPRQMLARGYAIVKNDAGRLVRSPDDAPLKSTVHIRLHRGGLNATVQSHRLDSAARKASEIPDEQPIRDETREVEPS